MTNPSPGGRTILIIEHDDAIAADLRDRLVGAGYAVQRVASGEEALVGRLATDADAIVLSLLLPDTDGLILCARLRARGDAPIIVLSDRPRDVDRLLALELGAHDFLGRPVDFGELVARLQAVNPQPAHQQQP